MPTELIVYGTTSNRTIDNNDGIANWDAVHDAVDGDEILTNYDDGINDVIMAGVAHTASLFIYRGFLFFDTSAIPDAASITSAILSIYAVTIYHTSSAAYPNLQITQGVQGDPVVLANYGDQLPYTTVLGQIQYNALVEDQHNSITLNSNGRAAISKTGTTKFCLRSELDVADKVAPLGSDWVQFHSTQKGTVYIPKLTLQYYTTTYPSDALTRVTGLVHQYSPGSYILQMSLGDVTTWEKPLFTAEEARVAAETVRTWAAKATSTIMEAMQRAQRQAPKPTYPTTYPTGPEKKYWPYEAPPAEPTPTMPPAPYVSEPVLKALRRKELELREQVSTTWRAITPWKEEAGETFVSEVQERITSALKIFRGFFGG